MPDEPRTTDRSTDATAVTRRRYLLSTGALGAVSLSGGSDVRGPRHPGEGGPAGYPTEGERTDDHGTGGDRSPDREDFLWVYGRVLEDDRLRRNRFAFAGRHDLAVVIQVRAAEFDAAEGLFRRALAEATAVGLDVWLRAGMLTDVTAPAFVADPDQRRAHLERLREVCRVYERLTAGGRVILWEEAPVFGQWVEGGEWTGQAVENLVEHGPAIFEAQRRAAAEATGGRDVGIFVHFPYVVDSKSPEVFRTLADRLAERGASPDFAFTDFYRGWYEKDAGPAVADDAVRSLIENARAALGGKPVFYLGQAHTIDPNHTPSKQSLRSNLRASLAAGADGLGWYDRTKYVPTRRGFDPFVPNDPDAAFEGPVATSTVARDRFRYAWLATLSSRRGFDPSERFDLWLRADDLSYADHRLVAKARDGWRFVCDVDGAVDGEYPYANGPDGDVAIVRGLRRDRWLVRDALDLRIESDADARESTLRDALVAPCEPAAYVAEHEAAALLAGDAPVESFALGAAGQSVPLVPGETRRLTVPIRRADPPSLHGLRHPDSLDAVRRLRELEGRSGFDPREYFDLWVRGEGVSDPAAVPSALDREGTPRSLPAASVVALGSENAALFYGLARERFLDGGLSLSADGASGTRVERAYAMPHAGSATFRPAGRAATLLAEQPGEVETYSLETVEP